jgi:hypothetical protein
MSSRRIVSRVALIAFALLFLSAGEVAQQKEAFANCWYPISYFTEKYYLVAGDCIGCEPVEVPAGHQSVDCEGNYNSTGPACGGLVRCRTTWYECSPICE